MIIRMVRKIAAALCLCLFISTATYAKELKVVTSIKPIHSLVTQVMGDLGEPELLVQGGLTPHIFRMKPSDFRKVANADVLFYISPRFETFLRSTYEADSDTLNAIALANQEGIKLHTFRDSKVWFSEESTDHDLDHGDHHHEEGEMDLHIWLDPSNTRRIVNIVKDTLTQLDPVNSVTYARNANGLITKLYEQEELVRELLRPLRDSAMIVYHDAFQYYEKAYSLRSFGAIQLKSDETPSVKHLAALKEMSEARNVTCVLGIPGTHPRIAMAVMGETQAGYAVVDHLGQYLEPGPDNYLQLIYEITQTIIDCQDREEATMFGSN